MPETLVPAESALAIARVAFALAIGFLIGLERGWRHRQEESGDRLAGIRTYTLYGFAGGLDLDIAGEGRSDHFLV